MSSLHRLLLQRISPFLAVGLWLFSPLGWSQSIVATVPLAQGGGRVAINTVTNKVYVANGSGITVIDGTTHAGTTLQFPSAQAPNNPNIGIGVNEVTNKIYIATGNGIVVIDGVTNFMKTVVDPNAYDPSSVAVNPITNKIYVANYGDDANGTFQFSNVTVIDGVTNATTTVTDPNASKLRASAIAVNTTTNNVYVANSNSVTVIDGNTNLTTTILNVSTDVSLYDKIVVDEATNKIYVAGLSGTTVIDGVTNATTIVNIVNPLDHNSSIALNSKTNKIYLTSGEEGSNITVIDGATLAITAVPVPNAGATVMAAVNENTDTVYVANYGLNSGLNGHNPASITIIEGSTNATRTLFDPHADSTQAVAVNPRTNQIYVLSTADLTIIDGAASPSQHALSVYLMGLGSGTVTSNPSGINCQSPCPVSVASFPVGTVVHLTAAVSSGVLSWSGACSGNGACDVTMNSDQSVVATFNQAPPGSSGGGGGGGGGGGIESLTLAALLSSLMAKLLSARQHHRRLSAWAAQRTSHVRTHKITKLWAFKPARGQYMRAAGAVPWRRLTAGLPRPLATTGASTCVPAWGLP